jgi:hypothetical protein
MPGTIDAAGRLRRAGCPSSVHRQAGDLLLTLAAVECHAGLRGLAAVPAALLRDLVIITARLVECTWLEADAGNAATLTAAQAIWRLPPPPELDLILARMLADRFGLPSPSTAA